MSVETIDFSTDMLPEAGRDAHIRDYYAQIAMRTELEPRCVGPITIQARSLLLPGVTVTDGSTSALDAARTSAMRSDGNSDVTISIPRQRLFVRERGREVMALSAGEAVITSWDRPVEVIAREQENHFTTLQLSRELFSPLVSNIDDRLSEKIPSTNSVLTLLNAYTRGLMGMQELGTNVGAVNARHLAELVALTIGATAEGAEQARVGGLRAARLAEAKAVAMENLETPTLSAPFVAARIGVSPRYLHMLFELDGLTFGQFVTVQRLKRAERLLCTPGLAARRVIDIALDVGFGDIRTFNRAFRKHFGRTPSETRHEALASR